MQLLGVVDHPNLVRLIGYCAVDGERGIQRLLVYEYMPNKSLEDHIFSRANPALSWDRRLQIMLEAAEGLAYLHEELEIQVSPLSFRCHLAFNVSAMIRADLKDYENEKQSRGKFQLF